jgi:dienelactone hydrolase
LEVCVKRSLSTACVVGAVLFAAACDCADDNKGGKSAAPAPVGGTDSGAANGAGSNDDDGGSMAPDDDDPPDDGGPFDAGTSPPEPDAGPPTPGPDGGTDDSDPPVPTAACGTDLDVHNGTVKPNYASQGAVEVVGDPITPGPYRVLLENASLDNPDANRNAVSVTTYAPTSDDQEIIEGKLPLIVVLPGFSGNHTGYRHFTDHFVSYGFAVLGVTPANVTFTDAPNNPANVAEVKAAVAWALESSALAGHIDEQRLIISGHSQGGKLAFFTAVTDPRFKTVLGWDPQNGGGAPCFIAGTVGQNCNAWPVAPNCDVDRSFEDPGMMANLRAESITFAARDALTTPDNHLWAEHFYRGAPSPTHLMLFPSASHGDWAAAGATTDVTKRIQMALLLTRFMGGKGLEMYLPDGPYAASQANLEPHSK